MILTIITMILTGWEITFFSEQRKEKYNEITLCEVGDFSQG